MQRILLCFLVAACANEDEHDTMVVDGPSDDPQHDEDVAVCEAAPILSCPPGYAYEIISGPGHDDLTVIDLAQAGVSLCGGHGVFVSPDELQGADRVGFNVTQNSVCTFGCFGGCPFWGACFANADRGEIACIHECSELTAERCEAFVQDCMRLDVCEDL